MEGKCSAIDTLKHIDHIVVKCYLQLIIARVLILRIFFEARADVRVFFLCVLIII